MIAYMAFVLSLLGFMAATWAVYLIGRLPDRIVSKLDTQILEVVEDRPAPYRDGDRFSQSAPQPPVVTRRHDLPPDGMTHAQREERTLRRGVPGWRGPVPGT